MGSDHLKDNLVHTSSFIDLFSVRFQHDSIETRTNENIQLYEDYKVCIKTYVSKLCLCGRYHRFSSLKSVQILLISEAKPRMKGFINMESI